MNSKKRLEFLYRAVEDGEDAKIIKHYVDEWVMETEKYVLNELSKNNSNVIEVRAYYRAVCRFADKVNAAIALGERKRQTLYKLKEEGMK